MNVICRVCGGSTSDSLPFCEVCGSDFETAAAPEPAAPGPEPVGGAAPGPEPVDDPVRSPAGRVCWNCGHAVPDPRNTECLSCGKSLTPPAVVIRFSTGQVEVDAGQTVTLGRLGEFAAVFVPFRNVSRRHARLVVEPDGTSWLEPVPAAPNGTFVDGVEIPAGQRERLRPGVRVRLAANLTGTVDIPPARPAGA